MMPRYPSVQTYPNMRQLPGPVLSQPRLPPGSGQLPQESPWQTQVPQPAVPQQEQMRRPPQEQQQQPWQTRTPGQEERNRKAPYRPLVQPEPEGKEEWVDRAHCSACSRSIDELFRDRKQRKVQQLKQEMFEQIYEAVGSEVAPEDLVSALVVRNAKFHPWTACVLAVFTLGIFCVFRPRDDDAVIVLTRQERVLLAKDERPSFCRGQALPMLLMFLRYLLGLLLLVSLPSIFFILAFRRWGDNAMSKEELQFLLSLQMDMERKLVGRLRRNYVLVACMGVASFLGLLLWAWANSPQDYGTRTRQSHAASTVCGGQLSLTGGEYRRSGVLRLFFGKYPTQTLLDSQQVLGSGEVVGPVRRDEVSSIVGGMARETTPAAIIAFTIMLSVVTLLDSSFSWLDRSWALARVAAMSEFCIEASGATAANCTRTACSAWAAARSEVEPQLCKDVRWYTVADQEGLITCEMYGHATPPCCGGCLSGGAMGYFGNGLEAFKGALGIIADVGTLIFSFIAARHAMQVAQARDMVDMTFVRTFGSKALTSNLELIQPLAAHFMESVFAMGQDKSTGEGSSKGAEGAAGRGSGVKEFEVNDEARDWDDFFASESLVLPGHSRWTPVVNVPRRCLGLLEGERVLAAWTETPQVTLVHVLPNVLGAILLFVGLLLWPDNVAANTFLVPNLGKGMWARLLSAFLPAAVFMLASMAITHLCLFRAVQHVVVVTDLRVFYVRYRGRCWCLCMLGMELRVDAFRHDRDVYYGKMSSSSLSFMQRITGVGWVPGTILMQVRFGMLQLSRTRGDALDVYNVIAQLTKRPDFLSRKDLEGAGVRVDRCQQWVDQALTRKGVDVWSITGQEDDLCGQTAEIYLSSSTEQPLFVWSFKAKGALGSIHDTNTDIVVTTGRLLLWSRTLYKRFDCKTSCCLLMGGICQCALCNGVWQRAQLPSSMSFLALSALMSFTTQVTMEPPLWYDPDHPPVKVKCFDELCEVLTRCVTCDVRGIRVGSCDPCPRRAGPRAQLSMSWQTKQNAQQPEPDLECSIRPYSAPDNADTGLMTVLGLSAGGSREDSRVQRNNAMRIDVLQKVMGVVQGLNSRG